MKDKQAIPEALLDELVKGYQKPEDLVGENGLLKQLTKAVFELAANQRVIARSFSQRKRLL